MSSKDKINNNIININSYKNKENKNMIIVIALVSAIVAILLYNYINQDNSYLNVEIEESNNISYNLGDIDPINPVQVLNIIESAEVNNKPILLHFYTTWCKVCKEQLPTMNELARKFQNTDLKILYLAIDNDVSKEKVSRVLNRLDTVYFEPKMLAEKMGFKDMLKTKSINFKNVIPYTILIDRNSTTIANFRGKKSFKYINKKVMKSLFSENES